DALRPEPGTRPVGRTPVERRAEHGHVVLAAPADVLHVRRLEECVDAGEVGQLAPGEGGDSLVHNGVSARQAELEPAGDLLVPLGGGPPRSALPRVAGLRPVLVVWVAHGSSASPARRRAAGRGLSPGFLSRRGVLRTRRTTCTSRTRPARERRNP